MDKSSTSQLEHLRQRFEDGDRRWPGLHHLFMQFGSESAFEQGLNDCNLFIEKFPKVVVGPLIGDRTILACSPSLHDIRASNRLAFGVAIDDPPGSTSALRRFTELALSVCRLLFPEKVKSFDNAYGHGAYWPDHWLAEVYSLGQESGDPLLHVREHQLEVARDRREFHLSPGYAAPMPAGDVVGIGGQSLPWHELMTRLAEIGLGIDVLEPGIFGASVRAIDLISQARRIPESEATCIDTPQRDVAADLRTRETADDPDAVGEKKADTLDEPGEALDDFVSLDQASVLVHCSKRTLERYLHAGKLPEPDIPGGDGKAHRWAWRNMRPALEEHFPFNLPKRFPSSRII